MLVDRYPALKQANRLPTETDREYAARQERVRKLVADAREGKIATINDAITANLNLEAMIFDLVPFLDAQPLHRLYQALITLSVLDPTCGSGAFLFAAIKILKPIYEQVLDRMALLAERRKTDGMPFRAILDAEQAHPNRDYFITKSIVVRNLYGVDLMEEATEICKLRLFLRLVADLEDAAHVEPLPDIDFNIRAGNSLVGYSGTEEIGGMLKGSVAGLSPRQQRMLRDVEAVQNELRHYRATQLQINPSSEVFRRARQEIRFYQEATRYWVTANPAGRVSDAVPPPPASQPLSFVDAAERVLDQFAHQQPMHYQNITSSDFSTGAREEAARSDATPVALMNGDQLVTLLIEHDIGVRRTKHDLIELGDEEEAEA